MQGLHEACLRLSAKELKGLTTSQDVNDASLWCGMLGQHLVETNFDDFIRPAAAKMLSQIEMTGVPPGFDSLEVQFAKELSGRVGWDVSGQVRSLFVSSLNDDVNALSRVSVHGLSRQFIECAAALDQMARTMPVSLNMTRKQPRLQEAVYTGFQTNGTYPPPAPRPPIISYCAVIRGLAESAATSAGTVFVQDGCLIPATWLVIGETCASLLGFTGLAITVAFLANEAQC